MKYEAWRITFQDSEQAARSAFKDYCSTRKELEELKDKVRHWVTTAKMIILPSYFQDDEYYAACDALRNAVKEG